MYHLPPDEEALQARLCEMLYGRLPYSVGTSGYAHLAEFATHIVEEHEHAAVELRACYKPVSWMDEGRMYTTTVHALMLQLDHIHTKETSDINTVLEAIEAVGVIALLERNKPAYGYTGTYIAVIYAWMTRARRLKTTPTFIEREHSGCDAIGRSRSFFIPTARPIVSL